MNKILNSIINELKEEIKQNKIIIKRSEDHIKVLSNSCTDRLEIIKKLEELK